MASREQAQAWMAQWRGAERELAAVARRDLARLTDEQALRQSEVLLALAAAAPAPPERLRTSGLVAQQSIFHRRPA